MHSQIDLQSFGKQVWVTTKDMEKNNYFLSRFTAKCERQIEHCNLWCVIYFDIFEDYGGTSYI